MSGVFDWWYRMRRAVKPPGMPTTRAAVPADAQSAREAELAVVFAHVDRLEPELLARETAGRQAADTITTDAEHRAALVVADSREQAAVIRAEAATARRREHELHAHELVARAELGAAEVRRRGRETQAEIVAHAVALVRTFAGERGGPGAATGLAGGRE